MARRKRSAYHSARRRVRSFAAGRSGPAGLKDIGAMVAYGYFRPNIKSFAQPAISMIPAGDYSDVVTLGLGAYAISYLLKPSNEYVKLGLKTVVLGEAFVAGTKLANGASITTRAPAASSSGYM